MSLPIPTATWIQWAQIAQFLRSNDQQTDIAFVSGSLNNQYSRLLYIVKNSVTWQYNNNNNDPNLLLTAPYMLALIGKYQLAAKNILNNLAGTAPSFTGPTAQTTAPGVPVTFTIAITGGSTPLSIQWFRNGLPILGATAITYTLANPQLSDSGANFSVTVTNGAGSATSSPVTLTVTNSITGFLYYSVMDPSAQLQASEDPFDYQVSYAITHNATISITIPSAATPDMYLVIKVPATESIKTTWANGTFNSGNIPDAIFQSFLQFGGFTYYYTRVGATMDATQPLTLS